MYTQTIYTPGLPALDRNNPSSYVIQYTALRNVLKLAEDYEMPGLVTACNTTMQMFVPWFKDQAFLTDLVNDNYDRLDDEEDAVLAEKGLMIALIIVEHVGEDNKVVVKLRQKHLKFALHLLEARKAKQGAMEAEGSY